MRIRAFLTFASVGIAAFARAAAPATDLPANPAPAATALNPALPTLFIAGDSTAAAARSPTQQGWGVPFAMHFDPTHYNVANRARGGRSSRTFITDGSWDRLLADIKPGDVVLIQFGHNDGGAINDEPPPPLRARGTLPGLGEETREIDNVLTKRRELVHTFGWYLRKYISDTRAKGARPVLLSLTARNIWRNGRIERGSGRYRTWSAEIARAAGVPFIDVTNLVADRLEALGPERTQALYPQDHTHFNAAGAALHAEIIAAELKRLLAPSRR